MPKTLIVDDDIYTCSCLKQLIDWEAEGYPLCGTAANGFEAIRLIEQENPDIIITDINMPGMNGLNLIKYLHQNYPLIKVCALSAYADYEYVRESMKMGAVDYLLKPNLTAVSLCKMLQEIKEKILHDQLDNSQNYRLLDQLKNGKTFLVQKFIRILLREGVSSPETARRKLHDLELNLGIKNLVLVAGVIDDYRWLTEKYSLSELNTLFDSLLEISREILKDSEKSLISNLEDGKLVIIFSFETLHSKQLIFNEVLTALNRIKTTVTRYLNITVSFAFDGICNEITLARHYFEKAEQLLAKKYYEGKNQLYFNALPEETAPSGPVLEISDEKHIVELIQALNYDRLTTLVDAIFSKILHLQPKIQSVKITFISLINLANKLIREYGMDLNLVYGAIEDPYRHLEKFDTVLSVKAWILEIYRQLIDYIKRFRFNPAYDSVITKALEYIHHHYQKEITLDNIAAFIGVNSSYLSRKFKKDCGKGVIEYLNSIRIEHAKALIKHQHQKVKDVACAVGYHNYNYFFKVFKDSEGMTPLEYEKSIRI